MLFCIYLYDLGFPSTDTMRWKSKIKCCCCRCCLVSVVLHGCIFFRSYSSFYSTLLSLFSSLTLSFFRCLSSCSAAAAISFVVAALEEVSVLSSYLLHIVCEIFFLWVFFVVTWIRHALSFRILFSCMFTSAAAKMFTLSGVGMGGFSKRRIVGEEICDFLVSS